jgi:PAS domain S-box-containing protein
MTFLDKNDALGTGHGPTTLGDLRTRVAEKVLRMQCLLAVSFCLIAGVALAVAQPYLTTRWVGIVLAVSGAVIAYALDCSGRSREGVHALNASLALALGYSVFRNGAVDAPAFLLCAPVVVGIAFTYGPSLGVLGGAAAFALTLLGEWEREQGFFSGPPPIPLPVRLTVGALGIAWAIALVWVPHHLLRRALAEAVASEARSAENARRVSVLSQAAFEAIVLSENGVILEANDQLGELVGYTRTEVVGMKAADLIAPRWRALVEARMRAQAEEPYEHELLHRNGTPIPVESRARRMPYEGRLVRVTAIRDMRDRKEAELRLRRSQEILRLALEGAHMGIWVLDVRSGDVEHSPRLPRYYAPGEHPPASRAEFLARVHPEDRARIAQAIDDTLTGRRPYEHVFRMLRPDGSVRWVEALGQVFRDETGAPLQLVGTVVDVTERVRGEERLRQSEAGLRTLNAELEQKVSERTSELTAANRELEAFGYSVSHDLRAPLRAINSFARFLAEDHAAELGRDGTECLERIRAASRRMDDLIQALLDLSRIARAPLAPSQVDLSELAVSIGAELARSQPERRVELVVAPGLVAEGDASLLRVVLTNLLDNAWKYTSKTPAPRVEVGAAPSTGSGTVYFVRDNGAGFDPRNADQLFGAFQRLHDAREFPGTGVGLATVQRIIHRHGGRIWAEAAPGKGATFFFTLRASASLRAAPVDQKLVQDRAA